MSGQVDPQTGMVCNLVDLDDAVRREVLERFDHENLNVRARIRSRRCRPRKT